MNDLHSGALRDALRYLKIDGLSIVAQKRDEEGYTVKKEGNRYTVCYGDRIELLRALGEISMRKGDLTEYTQKKSVDHLGYLIDTARNAVPTLPSLEEQFIRLAAFGYDRVYLYVEDVMQVENEPFFGHLRGRYSFEEMKQIDAYASELGISIVPCIQTLAHLNCMFKWSEYAGCNDAADILLIDEKRTYELIGHLFLTISRCFSGRHIHIGMDEAYLVGRGRHADLYGYEEKHALLKRHIEAVMKIADRYGFTAEIWSDMYFREAFGGGYYSAAGQLSDEICREIPKNVGLVYWDYFNRDERVIDNMFANHLKTGNDVIFAGGACKWSGWNPSNRMALVVGRKMLAGCKKYGVRSLILTAWSDDGAEASLFCTLPSMILYSRFAYGEEITDKAIDEDLKAFCGLSLEEYCTADLDLFTDGQRDEPYLFGTLPKILLYNDPLSGFYDGVLRRYDLSAQIARYKEALSALCTKCGGHEKSTFEILCRLCGILEIKWDLGLRLRRAYKHNDRPALSGIAGKEIPLLVGRIAEFRSACYAVWMSENKSNGFQTHDLRLGGLAARLETVKTLVSSYLAGETKEISELEEDLLEVGDDAAVDMLLWTNWKRIHSIYVI